MSRAISFVLQSASTSSIDRIFANGFFEYNVDAGDTGGLAVTGNENLQGNLQVGNVPGAGYAWGNSVIASQDYFVEVKGSGSFTGSTGYVFHNPNVSTAAITYKNTADNVGYFNFSSDDTSWNVCINNEVVPTVSRINKFAIEQQFTNGTYSDPDYGVGHAIKVGAGGIAVNGDSKFNNKVSAGSFAWGTSYLDSVAGTVMYRWMDDTNHIGVFSAASKSAAIGSNYYFNGSSWQRRSTTIGATRWELGPDATLFATPPSGSEIAAIKITSDGVTTLGSHLQFAAFDGGWRGLYGTMGSNDGWIIRGMAEATNAGYLEIATGDDGTEPIYVRQYTGQMPWGSGGSIARTLTLLDGSGNTAIPGGMTATGGVAADYIQVTGAMYAGAGLFGGGVDGGGINAGANVQLRSWYGIGFAPSISGYPVALNTNAFFIDVRSGNWSSVGSGNVNDLNIRSDIRLKTNFVTITNAMYKICQLTGKIYDKKLTLDSDTYVTREAGLIAQDLQKVQPESVHEDPNTGVLSIAPVGTIALLIEALKEVDARVLELEKRL